MGTKQKLALLLTLVTEPDILILDEPTNGLDIESSQIVLAVLKNLALHENVGILISSHKLEDIEANTQAIDHQQQTLRQSVYCLQQVMENDNFIG